jgi:hypothetical protein
MEEEDDNEYQIVQQLNDAFGEDVVQLVKNLRDDIKEIKSKLGELKESFGNGPVQETRASDFICPSIKKEQFSGGISETLYNAEWLDLISVNGAHRTEWIKWLHNILNHRAMIPYWSAVVEIGPIADRKEYVLRKVSTLVYSIMSDTLKMTFPAVKVGYKDQDGGLIKGTDDTMINQVSTILSSLHHILILFRSTLRFPRNARNEGRIKSGRTPILPRRKI